MPKFLGAVNRARFALAALLMVGAPLAHALVFAVNEGVTYRVRNDEIRARYAAIAADLAKLLKQPVTIEPVADYATLRRGLAAHEYDLAMVHPAHVSIVAMKESGYRLVVVTKGYQQYRASFLVRADSPLKSLHDLTGRRLALPDEDSITARIVRATLRDAQIDAQGVNLSYTRYQDAIPFAVENKLTAAGATAANNIVADWKAKGGKVLAQSPPVPIKHVIASPTLSADDVAKLRAYLIALDTTDEGRQKLEPSKYAGFERFDDAAMLAVGRWLGL